jgi:hypothetical protein
MPSYIVEQGDCISSIAYEFGFLPETVWNHPSNQALKDLRKDPNILLPGDQVYVPEVRRKELPAATDQRHVFKRKGVPELFQIVIEDEEGNPRKGSSYVLTIEKSGKRGKIGSDGLISMPIPPNAKSGLLIVGDLKDPHGRQEYELLLGHLDPLTDVCGIQKRLKNLGFDCAPEDGEIGPFTTAAIARFQDFVGLEPTGELDDQTRSKLESDHKS